MALDLNLLTTFLAVAKHRNFSVVAERSGLSRSAVSQAIRRLEDRLGAALVMRNTRSVGLTEAGQRLCAALSGALADVETAIGAIADDGAPSGLLRLAVASIAESFLSGPLVAAFARAHPRVTIDVTVTDEPFDIVARGFDAGVRLGESIAQDMIAVPIGGPLRQVAVASPDFVARHGRPEHPRDLLRFPCIGWRRAPEAAPYRWEFSENGTSFDIQVNPQLTTNDPGFILRSALAGAGIAFTMEALCRVQLERGELVSLLDAFLTPFPGFYLYFPHRRNMAPKLRAFVDHVRGSGGTAEPLDPARIPR